jgi:hypothetical protein
MPKYSFSILPKSQIPLSRVLHTHEALSSIPSWSKNTLNFKKNLVIYIYNIIFIILYYIYNIYTKSQTVAKIPNRCQNPKSLPKSQTVAKIPNCCQNPKLLLLPKSQIVAEIPNCCQNPKSLPKSQIF